MSRRKVRGLTKTGRQVSEDPDLDNLLSNLSPEEMEELQKEVSVVPDPDPSELIIVDQTDGKETSPVKKDSQLGSMSEDFRGSFQRSPSTEGEPKRESRKQEYLRKMGLSQENNFSRSDSRDGELQLQTSITSHSSIPKCDVKMEDRKSRLVEWNKDDKFVSLSKKDEESDGKVDIKEKEQNNGTKLQDRREKRESSSSKTKELISKLQEKKEDSKEKNRKDDVRKRESTDSRAKEMISRLQDKEIKEKERWEEMKKREEVKTKGPPCKLEEKQSQVVEDEMKVETNEKDEKQEIKSNGKEKVAPVLEDKRPAETKEPEKDRENMKTLQTHNENLRDMGRGNVQEQNPIANEVHESTKKKIENSISDTISKGRTKVEEEEDESASMFDEDLEKVRRDDLGMTELNVNNSEVIKTKTLIQFAEALKNNTHIKAFSIANCRADDHVAYAIAETLRNNKCITSINLDSNLLTSKGIMALIYALQHNSALTELRFHNQRHIIGGKSEMEMTKILKENTTLLKLGYHFELAGPRMTMTNILSRNMDRQRQKRLQEQKQAKAQGAGDMKDSLEVPKTGYGKGSPKASPKASPLPSPIPSPAPSPKLRHKKGGSGPGGGPPPPPPGGPPPPPPMLDGDFLKNSLTPVSKRKLEDKTGGRGGTQNSRDQLLSSIRGTNIKQLKKVTVPKLLQ
ncbi:Leiomodin-1 Smooth muscle leiomodin [Triplophysa tibetana]|uniref:Leiomodin-3 n=1 Tax=Triplophysa tibetana TaxID=1572043 RepID=A0A5A9NFV2_9TELE|nr:Leiomodin-1 Smooth muscle leiomodin [Triplophysa tibetana]